MLSITDRDHMVATVDTLAALRDDGSSIIGLLQQVREKHPRAEWQILLADVVDSIDEQAPQGDVPPRIAQALVELRLNGFRRVNLGRSAAHDGTVSANDFLLAVVDALAPMLQIELAHIEELHEIAAAERCF